MSTFLSFIAVIVQAVSPSAMPNNYSAVNIVYASQKNTLASSVLAVVNVPETQASKIAPEENEGEKIAMDDFGISEGSQLTTERGNEEKKAIEGWIRLYSAQYSVSYEEMRRVMQCESSGKIDAVGDNGKAFGLFQFWENTFNLFAKEMGENLDYKNPEHQIKLASFAFSKGWQTHWTCWKNISR